MSVYQTDSDGYLVGAIEPRVLRGKPLIPAGCVADPPPEVPAGKLARHAGGEWHIVDRPAPAPTPEPTPPAVSAARWAGYGDGAPVVVEFPGGDQQTLTREDPAVEAFVAAGGEIGSPDEPPGERDLAAERDARLADGFDFDFEDERGTHRIGTTEEDMRGWREVGDKCDLIRRGVLPDEPFGISTETGDTLISAEEWDAILAEAARFRQPIWQASFVLAAAEPIPPDFRSDTHWPARTI